MAAFYERLAELRRDAGLTQAELARAIGAAQSTLSQLEAGTRNPSFGMLRGIAAALNVSVPHLLGEKVEQLSHEEESHFREYRSLPRGARSELREYVSFLRQKYKKGGSR